MFTVALVLLGLSACYCQLAHSPVLSWGWWEIEKQNPLKYFHHKGGINVGALCHDSLICFLKYWTKRIKVDDGLVDLRLQQVHSLREMNGSAESAQYLSDNCLDPLSTKSLTKLSQLLWVLTARNAGQTEPCKAAGSKRFQVQILSDPSLKAQIWFIFSRSYIIYNLTGPINQRPLRWKRRS